MSTRIVYSSPSDAVVRSYLETECYVSVIVVVSFTVKGKLLVEYLKFNWFVVIVRLDLEGFFYKESDKRFYRFSVAAASVECFWIIYTKLAAERFKKNLCAKSSNVCIGADEMKNCASLHMQRSS